MLTFNVTNIANKGKEIYLWHRIGRELHLFKDNSFSPYYYQVSPTGLFRTIDGKKVNKIICRRPSDVKAKRDDNSYEADVLFTKRYIIDRISSFGKADLKYSFMDIEVLAKELPSYLNPIYPISCISCSNSYTGEIKTFYLGDWEEHNEGEAELLEAFVDWLREQQFDLILGWNFIEFDWLYLQARYKALFESELEEMISPIAQLKFIGESKTIPAGLSVCDYLELFKKIYKTEISYSLDNISKKYLIDSNYKKVDFSRLTIEIKEKNINDVRRMINLEKEKKIIEYYDELRRMSKCMWEDVNWNSKIIDMLLLQEAKIKGIILPSKKYRLEIDEDPLEGAYRRCNIENDKEEIVERLTGIYKNLWKLDLGSAYPQMIINFCLDSSNIKLNEGLDINGIRFYQNSNALLPTLIKKILNKKDTLKKELKSINPETKEYKDLQIKYDAIKAVANSTFGVTALKVFRLFDLRIASSITYLVRNLLHYIENKLKEQEMKVIYIDTDSFFIEAQDDPKNLLNQLVQQWGKEEYGKEKIDIEFEAEGIFEKIFIIALCHYKGYLRTKTGLKEEIKGVEAKRKDSSIFMQKFQNNLIEKILNKESQEEIIKWIETEKERIKTVPLIEIGFPCKINAIKDYKSIPIFMRALEYTKEIISFNKTPGDTFYYLYIESFGEATRKSKQMRKNKETGQKEMKSSETIIKKDVICFDEENQNHIKKDAFDLDKNVDQKVIIDWNKMIEKTIINKVKHIFEAVGWKTETNKNKLEQKKLIL
jgi:DNA polymerase elongation subunit (family B)